MERTILKSLVALWYAHNMAITLSGSVSPSKDELALDRLKSSATSFECIKAWCREHPQALGIHITDNAHVNVEFDVDWGHVAVTMDSGHASIPFIAMFDILETVPAGSITKSLLNNAQEFTRSLSITHTLDFSFDEWPFLTAELLAKNIDVLDVINQPNVHPFLLEQLGVLERYLPKHFPGMTYSVIQSLKAADLLPQAEENTSLGGALGSFLMAARKSENSVSPIPADLAI